MVKEWFKSQKEKKSYILYHLNQLENDDQNPVLIHLDKYYVIFPTVEEIIVMTQ